MAPLHSWSGTASSIAGQYRPAADPSRISPVHRIRRNCQPRRGWRSRQHGQDGQVSLIGQEQDKPRSRRAPLSKSHNRADKGGESQATADLAGREVDGVEDHGRHEHHASGPD